MSQPLVSKSAVNLPASQTQPQQQPQPQPPQPSATTNVFSRQVQSPPPPTPPAPSLRAKTVQFQQAGMPYMSGVQGPALEPEPWYCRPANYCCYLPFWAGAVIWMVTGLLSLGIILAVRSKPDRPS